MTEEIRHQIARTAIEEEGNADHARYWLDVLDPPQAHPKDGALRPLSWCGAFALWCLHQAGVAHGIKWIPGQGFLFRLKRTACPRVGDIAYKDQPFQHHGVVVEVGPIEGGKPAWVSTANGNSGPTAGGRVVLRFQQPLSAWTCFYDVEPWL